MDDKRFRTIVEKISEYIPVTNNEEKNYSDDFKEQVEMDCRVMNLI